MSPLPSYFSKRPSFYSILTFFLSVIACCGIILEFEKIQRKEERTFTNDLARVHAHSLQRNIEQALSATYALAALIVDSNGNIDHFDSFAAEILTYHTGVSALYAAPGGITSNVVPRSWKAKGTGINLLTDSNRKSEALLARDTGQLTLAGPLELTQGGMGVIGRLPIFLTNEEGKKQFWGLVSAVISLPKVVSDAALPQLEQRGYEYKLWRINPINGAQQIITQSDEYKPEETIKQAFHLPNAVWTLEVSSHTNNHVPYRLIINILLGLVFSSMLAYLVQLLLAIREQKKGLHIAIAQRTAELEASEADLNRAQTISKTGSWISTPDYQHIRFSKEARRIWHLPPEQKVSCKLILERIHPEDKAAVKLAWKNVSAESGCALEHRIIINDQIRWIHSQIEFDKDENGQVKHHLGIVQDITDRKQAEDDLRIAAIAFEGQEGMVITDAQRKILRVNHAFTRITGYRREEAIGKTTSLLKSGLHGDSYYIEMASQLETSGYWQGEIWNRRKNGEVYPEWLTITAVKSADGHTVNYVGTMLDITQRKATEAKLEHLAYHDPLTGLPNRRLLLDRLQHALIANTRSKRYGAILFLDLDNFKTINDTSGHGKGDLLLQHVAKRLVNSVRKGDTLARLGGDEFVLILEDLSDNIRDAAIEAKFITTNILADLKHPYELDHLEYHSSASIGIALYGQHNESAEELLKQVEVAMYEAKSEGGNSLCFFDPDMLNIVSARAAMESDMRIGIAQEQFVLYYQPQINHQGKLIGAEALIRWVHPQKNLISPAEFIPLAEESGLILPLGAWVLRSACQKLREWGQSAHTAELTLAVNVSARQFRQVDFVEQVLSVIREVGIDARCLKLELTESLLVENIEETIAKMNLLKSYGVGFSLDDFGTGYSSLSYLKRLPLDQLKIDQSFVRDILIDTNDEVITKTIIGLGQSLGLTVIAEGVETDEQRTILQAQGCQAFQGYLFGKPNPDIATEINSYGKPADYQA
ncbi:EAL domain-containing protein [Undibacterium sp. SXout7W]|uniref:bifunctional diguanylate cyclase/phosphodiesterase n=1 Tax=Undibacterium sp. SXout7W TaxID=3413049 RepID=UPI003BF05C21